METTWAAQISRLYINGEKVVEGKDYRKLICESSKTKNNQTDNDDLYKIYWEDTKMEFSATAGTRRGKPESSL